MGQLIVGNWKMNGLGNDLAELKGVVSGVGGKETPVVGICLPATLITRAVAIAASSRVLIGGQDCHPKPSGAHTGDISAEMLADAGAKLVIVGHSERRADHGENDTLVRMKAEAAWRAGLKAIVCVGETRAEREAGDALTIVASQLAGSVPDGANPGNLAIAYEPVWAIGTGLVAKPDDIAQAHAHIKAALNKRFGAAGGEVAILYGGSVKPDNAGAILALEAVGGALVGGASLKAADFLAIIAAAS